MNIAPQLRQRYFDANGNPLAGGKLYSYLAGTSTPSTTFSSSSQFTHNTNPVILDANGEASVWVDPSILYKFVLYDAHDALQFTVDNVMAPGLIGAENISPGAVTSDGLADGAVIAGKIADAAVSRISLAAGAIGAAKVVSKTATYTATLDDDLILVDGSGGGFTINLPAAASNSGHVFHIKRTDDTPSNAITVDPNGSETIDGKTTRTISFQGQCLSIISDGTNWRILGGAADSSEVYVDGGNGFGSAGSKIRRFTTARVNRGSSVTYADSATVGATFTINQDGLYGFSYSDNKTSGASGAGVTVNAGSLSVGLTGLTGGTERLGYQRSAAANHYTNVSGSVWLRAGDVVRAHSEDGTQDDTAVYSVWFRIIRLA